MTDSTSLPRRWTSLRFALRCVRVAAVIVVLPGGLRAQSASAVALPRDSMQDGLPLRPTRTLTFTTKTGHWMSSDVSSDGKLIVFDILGDLYTLPITGGKATTLTRGMSFDAQPRFSPDGKRVVFVSDRSGGDNLWTISLDRKDADSMRAFEAAVQNVDQVLSCHRISGRYDYQLMALAEDLQAYGVFGETYINALPGVKEVYTSFVMREVKAQGGIPLDRAVKDS